MTFLPQSGFVQQENKLGHVTVGYVSLRYTILANHYLACYLGVKWQWITMQVYQIIFEVDDFQSLLASDPEVHKTRLMAMDGDSRIDLWPKNLETELDNKRGLIPDIYSVNTGNMLLNDKALKLLEEYITEREELLPVSWG